MRTDSARVCSCRRPLNPATPMAAMMTSSKSPRLTTMQRQQRTTAMRTRTKTRMRMTRTMKITTTKAKTVNSTVRAASHSLLPDSKIMCDGLTICHLHSYLHADAEQDFTAEVVYGDDEDEEGAEDDDEDDDDDPDDQSQAAGPTFLLSGLRRLIGEASAPNNYDMKA